MSFRTKNSQPGKTTVILVAAVAITIFMALPRLAIIFFIRSQSAFAAANMGWMDFVLKCLFSFLVAWLFLVINTSRKKLFASSSIPDLNNFYQRMLLNIVLFFVVRSLATLLLPEAPAYALNGKFYGFLLNITLLLEISICILVAEGYMLLLKNQQMNLRNETLQKLNAETSYEALKNQVNPHFLFNSLTAIGSMIDSDSEAAKQFVNNMSEVYRYVLQSTNTPLVTFREELAFSMAYVNMLRERYDNKFKLETAVDAASLAKKLPPMSLQILVENAFKHNVVSLGDPLNIRINARGEELTVMNTMQERKNKPPSTGTGLFNLNRRYLYLCGKEIRIERKNAQFTVTLPLLHETHHS